MITAMFLPFAADVLSPHVSPETFRYHHGKHFKSYVNTVNELTAGTPADDTDLEAIIRLGHKSGNTALFNAAGQVWNHGFFWASLSPPRKASPSGVLADAISRDFGSVEAMAAAFARAGLAQFGSGWVWLAADASGALGILTTADAMPAWLEHDITPLLVCDVWEHAYYIDWRNDRGAFLNAFTAHLANWDLAEAQYAAVTGPVTGSASEPWCYPADKTPVIA